MEYIVFIIALSLLAAVVLLLTERQRLRLSPKKNY